MKGQRFLLISIALLISTIVISSTIYAQSSGWVDEGSVVRLETAKDGISKLSEQR